MARVKGELDTPGQAAATKKVKQEVKEVKSITPRSGKGGAKGRKKKPAEKDAATLEKERIAEQRKLEKQVDCD